MCYPTGAKQSLMYSWDLPLGEKVLLLLTNRLDPKVNGSGNFFLSEDSIRSGSGSVEGDSLAEETHKQQGEEEEEEEEEGKEEEEEGEEEGEEVAVGQEVTQYQGGTGEVDFSLPKKLRRLSDEVKKSVGRTSQKDKRRIKKRVYWISFMDSLQRVLLLTSSHSLVKSVSSQGGTTNKEPPHTELSLSLIGTGLSLVDDLRGQEVTYIGIPQSQKEWQIRVKKLWKALPHDVSDKLEKLHNSPSSQKTKGRRPIPDSVYEVWYIS
ncbi:Vacuolar protein sorting-associated protein 13A [Geodia barretti]|uniref:Vacuolar protein sorting-associated protein 13A n=1 Tax=Geodia barretti TaxID=519541 RepID=A0AA35RLS7_GEOBA|nr:Vacuolar protein sorting-associated protein 13A [Geodia barretti]